MAEVGRNFRTAYYESLGFKEGEKQQSQLENLLKADVIDVQKLKQFCLKYSVPVIYRAFVWKVMLGVEPANRDDDTCQFVSSQHKEQHDDLKRAFLAISGKNRPSFSSSSSFPLSHHSYSVNDFVRMYQIEKSSRCLISSEHLSAVASVVLDMFEEEMEAYFVFSRFTSLWEEAVKHLDILVGEFASCLKQVESSLNRHLLSLGAFSSISVHKWISRCFAGILSHSELENIWDKVISGSWMVVVYVAVAAVVFHSRQLMRMRKTQQILQLMENLPMENTASIVQNGLDLWERNGCPLHIASARRMQ